MIRFLGVSIFLVVGIILQVQAQIRIGTTLGYNLYQSVSREKERNTIFDTTPWDPGVAGKMNNKAVLKSGLHAGLLIDLKIRKPIHLQLGVLYEIISGTDKHYIRSSGWGFGYLKEYSENNHLTYLTTPVLLNFVKDLKKGKVSFSCGPQFSLGLGGWYKSERTYYNTDLLGATVTYDEVRGRYLVETGNDQNVNLYDESADPTRFYRKTHVALHFGVGYEVKQVLFRMYYAQGMTNTEPKKQAYRYNYNTNYSGINFSITYFFVRYAIEKVPR